MNRALACAAQGAARDDFSAPAEFGPRTLGPPHGTVPLPFPFPSEAGGPPAAAQRPPDGRFLRVETAPQEWLIGVPRPGAAPTGAALATAAEFLGLCDTRHRGPQTVFIRTGSALASPEFTVVLHHRRGRVSVYCPAEELDGYCAAALSVVATRAVTAFAREHGAPPQSAAVVRVPHVPDAMHPAAAVTEDGTLILAACSSLITSSLAEAVTQTWSAHLRFGASLAGTRNPA